MERIYLDYAATTPTHPDVVDAMRSYFTEMFGNPSAIYSYGLEAKQAVDEARQKVARLINARPEEVIFTGSGTESDNFALKGVAVANEQKGDHIVTSSIEHHAVIESCDYLAERGLKVTYLPVDEYGMVSPDDVKAAITNKTILISIMHANNEVGTIEPIAEIGKIAREAGIYFHTDAVQTAGHIPVDVEELHVDLLSLSAHKFYGPKGVGALFIRKGTKIVPLLHGGGQEDRKRASTENVPGIVGLGAAADICNNEMDAETERLTFLRDKLVDGLQARIPDVYMNGHPHRRLPKNVNVSVAYVEGESMCLNLDLAGICAATGSACSSSETEASHVLLAMGYSHEKAHGSLRFTLGKWTTEEHIGRVLDVMEGVIVKLRAISPLIKNK